MCKKKRIAVISDTHGLLRPEVSEILKTCDAILHAGDVHTKAVLEEIKSIAETYTVRGNNDRAWAEELPKDLYLKLFGIHIYMVHNRKHIPEKLEGFDLVVFGHSHKYEEIRQENTLFLNPGSCGPRRFHGAVTMAILTVLTAAGGFEVEKVELLPELFSDAISKREEQDLEKRISKVLKEMKKGSSISWIAEKYKTDPAWVEQVCRIAVTHPGVTAYGILEKMEVNNIVERKSLQ